MPRLSMLLLAGPAGLGTEVFAGLAHRRFMPPSSLAKPHPGSNHMLDFALPNFEGSHE